MSATPERRIQVCKDIAADMADDVEALDGKPFDGLLLGTIHGNLAAAIRALALIVAEIQADLAPAEDQA